MIIGIGIDLVSVRRIKPLLKSPVRLKRLFTAGEIAYGRSRRNGAESLAARFAAKEAFLKAIGTGWGTPQSPYWTEIEVVATGATPQLKLSGKALSICRTQRVKRIYLSLTHTADYATAVVLLEC